MISQQQLTEIGSWLDACTVTTGIDLQLRERHPEIHFTYCMDDDVVAAKPVAEHAQYNLYLVDSSNHCLGFTQSLEAASGLVVAEIEDE